jgi:hypothetical protein
MPAEQSYQNHRQTVPGYLVVLFVLFVNVGWAAYRLSADLSFDRVMTVLVAVALVRLALYARGFALRVQDRVIRLEMRLRLHELLPAELHARIHEFSTSQLIAMRFASDDELPTLAAAVLTDRITDSTRIKQMITTWQADHLRA